MHLISLKKSVFRAILSYKMKKETRAEQMYRSMKTGQVYRRSYFSDRWPATSRDLKRLLDESLIQKVGPGMYLKPETTKYGKRRPDEREIVKNFLRDDDFLLVDENDYTSLVSGLTQLKMTQKVLNRRRHGFFRLGGYRFNFHVRRNFPKIPTKEFLLVDLLDNVEQTEDGTPITEKVMSRLGEYDPKKLLHAAKSYGNRATVNFLNVALQV